MSGAPSFAGKGGAAAPPPACPAPPAPAQVLEETELQAMMRVMTAGFSEQSQQVEVFRQQVVTLSSNFDKMQAEFIESSKRQDVKFAEMKALQYAVIHQSVIESEN